MTSWMNEQPPAVHGEVQQEMNRIKRLFDPSVHDKEDLISYAKEIACLRGRAESLKQANDTWVALYGPAPHLPAPPQEAPEQAAKKPAIDPKQIKAIDDFLADGQEDKGYRAFAMMRHLWPKFRELALASSEAK